MGQGIPQKLAGGKGGDPSGLLVKHHLGLAGEGFTQGIRTSSKVAVCAPAKVTHLSELLYLKR